MTFLIYEFNRLKFIQILEHKKNICNNTTNSSYKSIYKFDTNLPKNSCLLRQNASYEYHPGFYFKNI